MKPGSPFNLVLCFLAVVVVGLSLVAFFVPQRDKPKIGAVVNHSGSYLNDYILSQTGKYVPCNEYPQLPSNLIVKNMGTTQDLYYLGNKVIGGDPEQRSYCVGLVLEVYMKSCEDYALQNFGASDYRLSGVDSSSFIQFRRDFYGFDGNQRTFVEALTKRGLGIEIQSLFEARPGDLVQFWRNNGSGHAVIFYDADLDGEGNLMVLYYWSVQSKTDGIGFSHERIGRERYDIDRDRIYITRPLTPSRI